jgi:hypothetical protein
LALDEECVYIQALHADDLAWGYLIMQKGDGATGQLHDGVLRGVFNILPQLLVADIKLKKP